MFYFAQTLLQLQNLLITQFTQFKEFSNLYMCGLEEVTAIRKKRKFVRHTAAAVHFAWRQ